MTGVVLTVPDEPNAIPGWLERHLLGPDLDLLAAELTVVHRPPDTTPVLDEVLGPHAPAVLTSGLAALPRPAVGLLLRNPALLPELRDLVLAEGGPYWDRYLDAEAAAAARVAEKVRRALGPAAAPRRGLPRWVGYAATAFATAAAVLVAVYLASGLRPPGPEVAAAGWGFQRIDQLPRDATDAQTFTALAGFAGEWGGKKPTTPAELLRRLVEFREGCGAIQIAANLPLSEPAARWLKLRCGDWAAEIDGHIRALERTRDVAAVRAAAARTADQISGELRARAAGA